MIKNLCNGYDGRKTLKRIITYGTFDLLHYGHINLLRRAKALGDYLIVCLSTDEFNWNAKHKKTYFTYEQRKQLLEKTAFILLNVIFHISTLLHKCSYFLLTLPPFIQTNKSIIYQDAD